MKKLLALVLLCSGFSIASNLTAMNQDPAQGASKETYTSAIVAKIKENPVTTASVTVGALVAGDLAVYVYNPEIKTPLSILWKKLLKKDPKVIAQEKLDKERAEREAHNAKIAAKIAAFSKK